MLTFKTEKYPFSYFFFYLTKNHDFFNYLILKCLTNIYKDEYF